MTNVNLSDLIDEFHFPINHIEIDGNKISVGTVGTCVIQGNSFIDPSFNWKKIYELNRVKLVELVYGMYQYKDDKLEITPKPDRVLELKFKGSEMSLPSVRYTYHSDGKWTLQRAGLS